MRSVGRLASVAALALGAIPASGCFYGEVINERPSAEIERIGDGEVFRGQALMMRALVDDPDRDRVSLQWRAHACDGPIGAAGTVCSGVATGTDPLFAFTVPRRIGSMNLGDS